jgi:hypothetical protein
VAIKEIVDKEAGDDGWYEIEYSGLFRTRQLGAMEGVE